MKNGWYDGELLIKAQNCLYIILIILLSLNIVVVNEKDYNFSMIMAILSLGFTLSSAVLFSSITIIIESKKEEQKPEIIAE